MYTFTSRHAVAVTGAAVLSLVAFGGIAHAAPPDPVPGPQATGLSEAGSAERDPAKQQQGEVTSVTTDQAGERPKTVVQVTNGDRNWTWLVGDRTQVRSAGQEVSPDDISVGDQVSVDGIVGPPAGEERVARATTITID